MSLDIHAAEAILMQFPPDRRNSATVPLLHLGASAEEVAALTGQTRLEAEEAASFYAAFNGRKTAADVPRLDGYAVFVGPLFANIKDKREPVMQPEDFKNLGKGSDFIIDAVEKAALAGRGGAGFPAAKKWRSVRSMGRGGCLVVNANEGELNTFKDYLLLKHEPYKVLAGALCAAEACGAKRIYIALKHDYSGLVPQLEKCIAALSTDVKITVAVAGGMLITGEETAVLEMLEGRASKPRVKPPYPSEAGLYGEPSCINNVETLALVPAIVGGNSEAAQVKLYMVSGDVNAPCIVEAREGVPLKEVIEKAGGVKGGWGNLQAVIPGGMGSGILTAAEAETAQMSDAALAQYGAFMGTGGITVIDKSQQILDTFVQIAGRYNESSCGKCSVCREGCSVAYQMLLKFKDRTATAEDAEALRELPEKMMHLTICALATSAGMNIASLFKKFPEAAVCR